MEVDSIRLMNRDVLIRPKPLNEIQSSSIVVVSKKEQNEKANWFEVVKVSSRVKEVNVGDTVLVPYATHTPIMLVDNQRMAITDEDSIIGVIESE